jgi:uncharacterized membrane protein
MTQPDQALLGRINSDVASIWSYLGRVSADLRELDRIVALSHAHDTVLPVQTVGADVQWAPPGLTQLPGLAQPAAPAQPPAPANQPTPAQPQAAAPGVRPPSSAPAGPRSDNWIGKALAVAGVAVTLVGVVLLVVLAAQAGILRPELRVGAGAVLAGALVGVAWWLNGRPGGRVGAIALAATGIAAAYIDIIAVATVYEWVPGAVALVLAAAVAGGGLTLARRWNSEQLALLVLVPLLGLGPAVTGGVTLLLVGFMLALSAATLPVQLGKDWFGMHAARMAVSTVPLLVALVGVNPTSGQLVWLASACGIATLLALTSAIVLLPHSSHPVAVALCSASATTPVLAANVAVDHVAAAVMAALLAGLLLALALAGGRLVNGDIDGVRAIWGASAAVSLLIAITIAFDGTVAGPLLLATGLVVAIAGSRNALARWAAMGFGVVGGTYYLVSAPPSNLAYATDVSTANAVSTLIASLLAVGCAAAITWSWVSQSRVDRDVAGVLWATAAVVAMYAITMFTVTTGVLVGGDGAGFFSGHVAATICWITLAAIVFRYATGISRAERSLPIGAGLALVAAAMAKLFLFDLGTLDGIFRVIVFIVVGLALLGMGAGYARLLSQQDEREQQEGST